MGYPYVVEGGATPMLIGGGDEKGSMGGGVLVILLFIIAIAIAAFSMWGRREPVVAQSSPLETILPAMMVSQMSAQRQSVDVNSHNTGVNYNPGPSNFDIYKQGVSTNDNVFAQSCETRTTVIDEASKTRDLINQQTIQQLRDTVAFQNAALIQKDNQLIVSQLFAAQGVQNQSNYNALTAQIANFQNVACKTPVNARLVDDCRGC